MAATPENEEPALNSPFSDSWVLVRGGGDIVSGAIQRLRWAGFGVLVTELAQPLVVRRLVAFANAVYEGDCQVEGTPARLVTSLSDAKAYARHTPQGVPVIVDPEARVLEALRPAVLVDGRMAKRPLDTRLNQAPIVIALGPGFEAGLHAHAVIETQGGSQCGRAYYAGSAQADSGRPCDSSGYREERVLRAPAEGVFVAYKEIGQVVAAGETVGWVEANGKRHPVNAQISGVLRGVLHTGLAVGAATKLGDIDHRGTSSDCCRVSEKADSVAAGVMEATFRLALEKRLFTPS